MPLDMPAAGAPILDTWGADVADRLNRHHTQILTVGVATNSATAVTTGLSFPVVAGKAYNVRIYGHYMVSATNQGLQLAINGPVSGTWVARLLGNASATGESIHRASTDGTLAGRTATDAASAPRDFWMDAAFSAHSNGTATVQFARGGTSGSTGATVRLGTAMVVTESA